jgi:hypothetical protein
MIDPRLAEWFASGDTGQSSVAVATYLAAGVSSGATPGDTQDLGRIMRLLDRIPEWKTRMGEMAEAGGSWPLLAPHWQELDRLYRADLHACQERLTDILYDKSDLRLWRARTA